MGRAGFEPVDRNLTALKRVATRLITLEIRIEESIMLLDQHLRELRGAGQQPTDKDLKLIISLWFDSLFDGLYKHPLDYIASIDRILNTLNRFKRKDKVEEAIEYWSYMKQNKQQHIL